jgi:hypothetical protein
MAGKPRAGGARPDEDIQALALHAHALGAVCSSAA